MSKLGAFTVKKAPLRTVKLYAQFSQGQNNSFRESIQHAKRGMRINMAMNLHKYEHISHEEKGGGAGFPCQSGT